MCSLYPPINKRVPHLGGDSGGLGVSQLEDALYDGELRAGGVQAAEADPVVDDEPSADHVTAAIHRARLTTCRNIQMSSWPKQICVTKSE